MNILQFGKTSGFGRAHFLASTFLGAGLALLSPSIAAAQTEPAQDAAVETVVVTAQRRSENIQDVPITITAIGGEALTGRSASATTVDLQRFVPGMVAGQSGTASSTFLRGVGTDSGVAGAESPVATYLDGIYLGINSLSMFELDNISQISVLKGPQGTLFGRNASGGVIQVSTRDPSQTFEGSVDVGYGNFETSTAHGYISGPLTENLSGNLALFYKNRDRGLIYNQHTGNRLEAETVYTGQGKLLWVLSDDTSVRLNVIRAEGYDTPGVIFGPQRGALAADGITTYVDDYVVNLANDGWVNTWTTIAGLTITHDFSWASLTNTTAGTQYEVFSFDDQAPTAGEPNPNNVPVEVAYLRSKIGVFTNELQLQSLPGAEFQWVAGLFYLQDSTKTDLWDYLPAYAGWDFFLNSEIETESYAAYVQGTRQILPDTNLTLGFRYSSDTKTFNGQHNFGVTVGPGLPNEVTFEKPTWRVAIDHQLTDDLMIFASYNRGFRAGNFGPLALTTPAVRPEVLDAYEIGFKSDLFDNMLRLNASAFYYDYKDMQLRAYIGSPPTAVFFNAANSEVYGIDVDFVAQPTANLTINGGFEYLQSEYTEFPGGLASYPRPLLSVPAGCTGSPTAVVGGITTLSCDLSGNTLINAPEFSFVLGFDYRVPTALGDITFSVADKYTDDYFASPDNFQEVPGYHWVTASVNWTSTDGAWYGKIWGTNLTDAYNVAALTTGGSTYEYVHGQPRFYGVTLGRRF